MAFSPIYPLLCLSVCFSPSLPPSCIPPLHWAHNQTGPLSVYSLFCLHLYFLLSFSPPFFSLFPLRHLFCDCLCVISVLSYWEEMTSVSVTCAYLASEKGTAMLSVDARPHRICAQHQHIAVRGAPLPFRRLQFIVLSVFLGLIGGICRVPLWY